jgi:PPOX class probable F420-dependent enzyme
MRKHLSPDELGDLLDRPLVAVLATYRGDGSVLLSPVWHEWRDGGFDVITRNDDVKVQHLQRDPRASIVVYEHGPPYRGIEVRGEARLTTEGVDEATRRIATRYLGAERGADYLQEAADDTLVRLEGRVRAWDFADDAL